MIREQKTEQGYTGIILAGGQSSRMGKEKGLIQWKGKTLIENAIAILSPLCEHIFISANNDHFDSFGYPVVGDLFPDCGPMGGIYSALTKSGTLNNIVIPSDTPFVTPALYRYLISHAGSFDVIVPVDHDSFYQPLCAVYSRSVLPAMGLSLIIRAVLVVTGFSALSTELRNPSLKSLLLKFGFHNIYTALSMSFSALPFMMERGVSGKDFLFHPIHAIRNLLADAGY